MWYDERQSGEERTKDEGRTTRRKRRVRNQGKYFCPAMSVYGLIFPFYTRNSKNFSLFRTRSCTLYLWMYDIHLKNQCILYTGVYTLPTPVRYTWNICISYTHFITLIICLYVVHWNVGVFHTPVCTRNIIIRTAHARHSIVDWNIIITRRLSSDCFSRKLSVKS